MRIDVHTHIWPERIAGTVLDSMVRDMGLDAVGVNTVEGVKAHMRESGVDKSVVLGVVERPGQVKRANDWLISIQDDMLVPFRSNPPGTGGQGRRGAPPAGERHQGDQAAPGDEQLLRRRPQDVPGL